MLKRHVLTNVQSAQHSNAGQNILQLCLDRDMACFHFSLIANCLNERRRVARIALDLEASGGTPQVKISASKPLL